MKNSRSESAVANCLPSIAKSFNEQIDGVKSTLLKREEEAKQVEHAKQDVIYLNQSLGINNEGLMKQANDRALQVSSPIVQSKERKPIFLLKIVNKRERLYHWLAS